VAAHARRGDDLADRVGVVDEVLPERLGGRDAQLGGECAHLLRTEWLGPPAEGRVRAGQRSPSFAVQAGQAPQPCEAWTFSAIAICCSRVARWALGAYWPPPCPIHVCGWNWRPPEKPLPVLMLQSPPDSHAAIESHTPP